MLKILYSNPRGIRSKLHSLQTIANVIKPGLIILVETHLVGKNTIKIEGYDRIITRNRKSKGGGLLIALKDTVDAKMVVLDVNENHEQMWIQLSGPDAKFNIGIAYGLHETRCTKQELENWHYELEEKYAQYNDNPTIIIGDMNAHVGNDEKGVKGNTDKINQNGEYIRNLIERRELTLANNLPTCNGTYTRVDPKGDPSIIDLILANTLMQAMIKHILIDENRIHTITRYERVNGKAIETPSDHNTILIDIDWKQSYRDPKTTVWNYNDQQAIKKFSHISENAVMKENWTVAGDADEKYSRWFNQLKSMMYSSFKRVTIKKKYKSSAIHRKVQQKHKLKKIQSKLNKKKLEKGTVHKAITGKINQLIDDIITEDQKQTAENLTKRMQQIVEGEADKEDIWTVRRRATKQSEAIMALKDEKENMLTNPEEIQERYINYYTDLLQPRTPDPEAKETLNQFNKCFSLFMQVKTHDEERINDPFTPKELDKVIKKLKKNKSPGDDGITNELVKAFGTSLKKSLLNMMNWMHLHEKIPGQLLKINIKSLYKGKGQTSDLKNHRGIFISSTVLKIYEGLYAERTSPMIENKGFTEAQAGGRKNRGIGDQIFILRSIMDYYKYINKPLILEFIDLVKAFDKMILKNVMIDLWNAGVRGRIWRNIYTLNKEALIKVKTPMGPTRESSIGETLKQGSVLASTLAALHTDGVNRMFKNSETGITYGNLKIQQLLFQDDILRIEDDHHKLNTSNVIYTWFGKINGMKYHEDKSMYLSTSYENHQVILAGHQLKKAEKYKYLADIITPTGGLGETIKQRKNQILGLTTELATIISLIDESGLHVMTAKKYYEAIIIPKLLTNAETWNNLTSTEIAELEGIQNRSLKRLLRLPQGTPSQGLLNEMGMWNIQTIIMSKKLMFLYKVLNYNDENITKQVLLNQVNQPGPTWISSLEESCKNINIKIEFQHLQNITKATWKKEVKQKLNEYQKAIFTNWQKTSKKCHHLEYSNSIQSYLVTLSKENAITILKERLKMTDVKINYKNKYDDTICRICQTVEETSQHLMECYYKDDPQKHAIAKNLNTTIANIRSTDKEQIIELAQIIKVVLLTFASTNDAVPTITGNGASDN